MASDKSVCITHADDHSKGLFSDEIGIELLIQPESMSNAESFIACLTCNSF